jgi:hypothetical protein
MKNAPGVQARNEIRLRQAGPGSRIRSMLIVQVHIHPENYAI